MLEFYNNLHHKMCAHFYCNSAAATWNYQICINFLLFQSFPIKKKILSNAIENWKFTAVLVACVFSDRPKDSEKSFNGSFFGVSIWECFICFHSRTLILFFLFSMLSLHSALFIFHFFQKRRCRHAGREPKSS